MGQFWGLFGQPKSTWIMTTAFQAARKKLITATAGRRQSAARLPPGLCHINFTGREKSATAMCAAFRQISWTLDISHRSPSVWITGGNSLDSWIVSAALMFFDGHATSADRLTAECDQQNQQHNQDEREQPGNDCHTQHQVAASCIQRSRHWNSTV